MEDQDQLEKLERQLERSGFFTHHSLSAQANRINEIEGFLFGLIDLLLQNQQIDKEGLEAMTKRVRDEIIQRNQQFHAGIAIRVDRPEETTEQSTVHVDCAKRFHVCQGVCCRMNYALSVEEIESGKVKWDLGQPYFIRQEKSGYCAHMNLDGGCCTIYPDRPRVCRKYSCADDKRIWVDFEKMELNHDWIEKNLAESSLHIQAITMIPGENLAYRPQIK